jgi:putative transposase
VKFAFIALHKDQYKVVRMCKLLDVSSSGFYVWRERPASPRVLENKRLLGLIKELFQASHQTYGSPRVLCDLHELGETCNQKRVARLMRVNKLRAHRGYRSRRHHYSKPDVAAPNHLQQDFVTKQPNIAWVTDITYIRTMQGWLYLSVVIDLFSRKVVGWSMKSTMNREIALDALLMAVNRREPTGQGTIHSDQGSQFSSDDWLRFCKDNRLTPSMSRRGNCYDNAVAETFFSTLKKERIRNEVYPSRDKARADIFDYIEVFYNKARRHTYLAGKTPEQFEIAHLEQTRLSTF